MGEKRSQTIEWERWVLNSPDKMSECLIQLVAEGRNGSIRADHDPDGKPVWLLEIGTDNRMAPVLANMGMIVIRIGTRLEALFPDQYHAVYGDDGLTP